MHQLSIEDRRTNIFRFVYGHCVFQEGKLGPGWLFFLTAGLYLLRKQPGSGDPKHQFCETFNGLRIVYQSKTAFAVIGGGIITIVVIASLLLMEHETKANCTAGLRSAYPNRAGFVVTIHGLECGGELAGQGYETISVFVHRTRAQNDVENTAFEYIATARGNLGREPPVTHWNGPRSLTIALRPDDIEQINVQKHSIGDVHISYVIKFDCLVYTESNIKSTQGYVGTLRVSSCSSTESNFTYYYSVFVHKVLDTPAASNLVFKYKATLYGAEFGTPKLKWKTPSQLTITVDQGSIDYVSAKKAFLQNVKVYYDYRSHH